MTERDLLLARVNETWASISISEMPRVEALLKACEAINRHDWKQQARARFQLAEMYTGIDIYRMLEGL